MEVSYSHVSDEYPEEFIKRLHRAQGEDRLLVRNPNPDGKPYGITQYKYWMWGTGLSIEEITDEVEEYGDEYHKQLHNYYMEHWRDETIKNKNNR